MKKRKRISHIPEQHVITTVPHIPSAPLLTQADLDRFHLAQEAWSCSTTVDDRIEYCRNRLSHYLPQQMPPLVQDVLSIVFHERKPWMPWNTFRPRVYASDGVVDNFEKRSNLSVIHSYYYIGFTTGISLLDSPRKWSCRILDDTNPPNTPFVAFGVYNHVSHQKRLASDRDCSWYDSIHIETWNSAAATSSPEFSNRSSDIRTSIKANRFDTMTIEVFPQQKMVRFKMANDCSDVSLDHLSEWRPYVCLYGLISVELQEE